MNATKTKKNKLKRNKTEHNLITDKSNQLLTTVKASQKKHKKKGGNPPELNLSSEFNITKNTDGDLYNYVNNLFKNTGIRVDENINNKMINNKMIKLLDELNTKTVIKNDSSDLFLSLNISDTAEQQQQQDQNGIPLFRKTASFAACSSETSDCITYFDNKNATIFDGIFYLLKKYINAKNIFSNTYDAFENKNIFTYFKLYDFENDSTFITVDPTIIQFMIFDTDGQVHSLKFIVKNESLHIRYTNKLFPSSSEIKQYGTLEDFNKFNLKLNVEYITTNYNNDLKLFLMKYLNLYIFYKKCFKIDGKDDINDYNLKYVSILGKARFFKKELQLRCKQISEYIMTNLLFINPMYAFISGGYKGFNSLAYGITRSGYEISKKYNRPIMTIMCNEGLNDSHEFSDATLIYGEHWGEDTIALSQFTDGAIIVAPFGGWTYVECLCLLSQKRIIGIYNNSFDIIKYNSNTDNIHFFKFSRNEQLNIIQFYMNYYIIIYKLYFINIKSESEQDKNKILIHDNIHKVLKLLFLIKEIIQCSSRLNFVFTPDKMNKLQSILTTLNRSMYLINKYVNTNLSSINKKYIEMYNNNDSYQTTIPDNCDGIWIHPKYDTNDLITYTKDDNNLTKIKNFDELDNILNDTGEMYKIYQNININIYNIDNFQLFNDKNINNEIIFVFSDIIYLGIYINENLNSRKYSDRLQKKINELENYDLNGETLGDLVKKFNTLKLKRNLDGYLDENGVINNQDIINKDYFFVVKNDCTTILPNQT
jgi:hypothetical protein